MSHPLLLENQSKRLRLPFFMLLFFSMFTSWQMGYIYYMGPSLVIDGRTPLPISMDNVTTIIAAGYVLSIIYMLVFPKGVIHAEKVSTSMALVSVLGLFLPFSAQILKLLVYMQVFFCCFMIGFETFIIVNYFSENTAAVHLTLGYSVATFIAGFVQNDIFPLSFSAFRILTVIMLTMMLVFFFRLPTKDALPVFVKKSHSLPCPKKLFFGVFSLLLVSCLMMLCGPTAVGEIRHGVFISYTADALGSLFVYILYKKANIHPLKTVSVFIGLSAIGFLLLFASYYIEGLAYIACVLIGLGYASCQFQPLFGIVLMKNYPSRFIVPGIVSTALVTVLIQSTLVEMFREIPQMLNLAYLLITIILAILYLQLEPYLIYALQRRIPTAQAEAFIPDETEALSETEITQAEKVEVMTPIEETNMGDSTPLSVLTKREYQVLSLIAQGYSNSAIAKELVISEHTVNDYTKKIYKKLDVHSRHAAASMLIKHSNNA